MSKIDEMIAKLCPNGVEYIDFLSVCNYIRGITYNKNDEINNGTEGIGVLRANNITLDSNTLNFDDVKIVSKNVRVKENQWLKKGDILICAGSGSKEHIGKVAFIFNDLDYTFGGFMGVIRPKQDNINSSFLFHIMTSQMFKTHLAKASGAASSTINNINNDTWNGFQIPVPPLKIQEEIVAILDDYTEINSELISNLEKELIARKKQYEFYRDQLLSFGKVSPPLTSGTNKVNWMTLGEISDLLSGFPFNSEQFTQKGIKLVRGMNVKRGYLDFAESNNKYWATDIGLEKYRLMAGDIIIAMDGSLVGKSFGLVSKNDLPLLLVQRVARIRTKESYCNQYICHCIKSALPAYVDSQKTAGAVPHISLKDLSNFKIPVPCFAEQKRIATILTHFDTLANDISQEIPAEIEARKKQYEFYRDKLLSFKEAV